MFLPACGGYQERVIRSRWRSRTDLDHPDVVALAVLPRGEVVADAEARPWVLVDLDEQRRSA
jgi:hypothetical protein